MRSRKRKQSSTLPPSEGVVKYVSTVGEVVLAVIVGQGELYNAWDPDTLLVPCLILYSEVSYCVPGTVKKFGAGTIRSYLP